MSQIFKRIYHRFIAVLATVRFGFPARKLKLIGVTGTDGKTTTAHLIYLLLSAAGKKVGLVTTVDARIGGQIYDTGFHTTSPDAWHLQKYLHQMVEAGEEYAVLETTSHGLAQDRFWGLSFAVGVVTNLTHEHLDYHGSIANYRKAKAILFRNSKVAVLNADDESVDYFKSVTKGKVLTYALKNIAEITPQAVTYDQAGQELKIGDQLWRVPLYGVYNTYNLLAAWGVANLVGVTSQVAQEALNNYQPLPGRFELIDEGQDYQVVVDFAHTPNALEKLLSLARSLVKDKRIVVVFGCAGLRDTEKRPLMGRIAVTLADLSVFTSEDPRTEDEDTIISEIVSGAVAVGGVEGVHFFRKPDRGEAIAFAIQELMMTGDMLIVTGKGHEHTMCYGSQEVPWSDQEFIRQTLRSAQ